MSKKKNESKSNLDLVSDSEESTDAGWERRKVARLNFTKEQFRISDNGKIFPVVNLSVDGFAVRVLDDDDTILFSMGRQIEGTLNIAGEKLPVKAQVRHRRALTIGCEFDDEVSKITRKSVSQFLDPKALASELKLIPASQEGATWYHGPLGVEVSFLEKSPGEFSQLALYLYNSSVQWNPRDGLRTATVKVANEASEVRGVVRYEPMLLDFDESPDSEKLTLARKLISNSQLPDAFKSWADEELFQTLH